MSKITIGLVDDHNLFRGGVNSLLSGEDDMEVILEAESGERFLSKLESSEKEPNIVLSDIKMNGMLGYELTEKLAKSYPNIKVLALSMYVDEASIIKMVKSGAKGYVLKGAEPWELIQAIKATYSEGYFFGDDASKALLKQVHEPNRFELKDYEADFLLHCCSELSYKDIAGLMGVAPRTIDGYRERLFPKIGVRTRVGAVLYAFKHNIYKIDN